MVAAPVNALSTRRRDRLPEGTGPTHYRPVDPPRKPSRVAGRHCCLPAPSEPDGRPFDASGSSKPRAEPATLRLMGRALWVRPPVNLLVTVEVDQEQVILRVRSALLARLDVVGV